MHLFEQLGNAVLRDRALDRHTCELRRITQLLSNPPELLCEVRQQF